MICENLLGGRQNGTPASAVRQDQNAREDFGERDGRCEDVTCRLATQPFKYAPRAQLQRLHDFRQDIRIDHDHAGSSESSWKRGGSRIGIRIGKSSSMPPMGSTMA